MESLDALVERCGSKAAAARELGVPISTFKDRLAAGRTVQPAPSLDGEEFVEIPVIFRDYSHLESLKLYPLGDVHIGAAMHNAKLWAEWLEFLRRDKRTSLLVTGDMLNCAILGSKSDVYDETMSVGDAKRLLRKQLAPLAAENRIDAALPGNHEHRVTKAVGDCPILDVCDSLEIPYIATAGLVVYTVGDQTYECFVRHGTGNGQSLVAMDKSVKVIDADIYVSGHIHNQAARVNDRFVRDGDRVVRRKFVTVTAGSFLAYEAYCAQGGYAPGHQGSPRLFLDGRKRDYHVSL